MAAVYQVSKAQLKHSSWYLSLNSLVLPVPLRGQIEQFYRHLFLPVNLLLRTMDWLEAGITRIIKKPPRLVEQRGRVVYPMKRT